MATKKQFEAEIKFTCPRRCGYTVMMKPGPNGGGVQDCPRCGATLIFRSVFVEYFENEVPPELHTVPPTPPPAAVNVATAPVPPVPPAPPAPPAPLHSS